MKTSKLTGAALDWAAAKCEGGRVKVCPALLVNTIQIPISIWLEGVEFSPSTDWAQAGPIIEREKIHLRHGSDYDGRQRWEAAKDVAVQPFEFVWEDSTWFGVADTPLIAAMRCYVASKLGDEVDIPEELK